MQLIYLIFLESKAGRPSTGYGAWTPKIQPGPPLEVKGVQYSQPMNR